MTSKQTLFLLAIALLNLAQCSIADEDVVNTRDHFLRSIRQWFPDLLLSVDAQNDDDPVHSRNLRSSSWIMPVRRQDEGKGQANHYLRTIKRSPEANPMFVPGTAKIRRDNTERDHYLRTLRAAPGGLSERDHYLRTLRNVVMPSNLDTDSMRNQHQQESGDKANEMKLVLEKLVHDYNAQMH